MSPEETPDLGTTAKRARLFVQFGCGTCAPAGWGNYDCSPSLWLQRLPLAGTAFVRCSGFSFPANVRYGDVVRGLPVAPHSADAIYCSHVLEHLCLADLRRALRNTRSYLLGGGIFRLVLPDLKRLAQEYVQSMDDQAGPRFMREASLGIEERQRGLAAMLRHVFGNATHLWMWDYESLARELRDAGFAEIRRAYYHDSAEPRFADVETFERWDGHLGIECRAPRE